MIEDKELGLKIADNPEEEMFIKIKENLEKQVMHSKADIELNEVLLEYLKKKLKGGKK